ncbi:MAG: hypothetical protein AB1486_13910 [Planctomycetota bacterium]
MSLLALRTVLNPATLALLIPIAAIVVGGIVAVVKAAIRHQERMAMIERGMHPDHPGETSYPYGEADPNRR